MKGANLFNLHSLKERHTRNIISMQFAQIVTNMAKSAAYKFCIYCSSEKIPKDKSVITNDVA